MYKIMTIDVWDTLLRRDCHPECIKLATALHLFFGWRDQIKPEFRDSWLLYKARLEAESTIAQQTKVSGKDDEYEIVHVLDHWLTGIFANMPHPALSVRLSEFELSVEIARSYADPNISDFLIPYEAEKTIFLSDFYMGADMLSRLLASKGLNTLVSGGLSSCDVGYNKRSGNIFKHLHSIHSVSPEQHVHIGDNEWSDVASPRSLGVVALHYLPQSAHNERLAREHLFSSREVLFEHILVECTTLSQDLNKSLSSKHSAALSLGVQVAPMLIGFVLWISERAVQHKLERLHFLNHEGEFLNRVFCAIFPKGHLFGHHLPTASVLDVCKLVSFVPTMKDVSITEINRIWSLLKVKNLSSLFVILGLDIKDYYELLKILGLRNDEIVSDPENCCELQRLFETPAFVEGVKTSLSTQFNTLQCHLKKSGLNEINRVGIVNTEWSKLLQDNLALLVPELNFRSMNLSLSQYITLQQSNGSRTTYVTDEEKSNNSSHLYGNLDISDSLLKSLYATVIGHTSVNGRIKALSYVDKKENVASDEFIKAFQDGILLAAQIWQPYLDRYAVTCNELRNLTIQTYNIISQSQPKDFFKVNTQKTKKATIGNESDLERNPPSTHFLILSSPFLSFRIYSLIKTINRSQWTQVIRKLNTLNHFKRILLTIFFRLTKFFKKN
jgi:FMN phosphatase YigB (HAD superfamily)